MQCYNRTEGRVGNGTKERKKDGEVSLKVVLGRIAMNGRYIPGLVAHIIELFSALRRSVWGTFFRFFGELAMKDVPMPACR